MVLIIISLSWVSTCGLRSAVPRLPAFGMEVGAVVLVVVVVVLEVAMLNGAAVMRCVVMDEENKIGELCLNYLHFITYNKPQKCGQIL